MIYVFDNREEISGDELDLMRRSLDKKRQKKFDALRRREDKLGCAAAYLLLSLGLRRQFGIADFEMTGEDMEKPALKNCGDIQFNLSHCEKGCACIVSKSEVGIDIQDAVDLPDGVTELVCTESEKQALEKSTDRTADFIKMWTLKEAVLKMLGTGLAQDMKTVDTERLEHNAACRVFERFTLAAAGESREEDVGALLENAVFITREELLEEAKNRTK